jgi:hypothetical protein
MMGSRVRVTQAAPLLSHEIDRPEFDRPTTDLPETAVPAALMPGFVEDLPDGGLLGIFTTQSPLKGGPKRPQLVLGKRIGFRGDFAKRLSGGLLALFRERPHLVEQRFKLFLNGIHGGDAITTPSFRQWGPKQSPVDAPTDRRRRHPGKAKPYPLARLPLCDPG